MPDAKITVTGQDVNASDVVVKVGQALTDAGAAASTTTQQLDALGSEADNLAGVITNAAVVAAGLGDAFGSAADEASGVLTPAVQETKGWFDQLTDSISKIGTETGDAIKEGIEDPLGTAKGALEGVLEDLGPVGVGLGVITTVAGAVGGALVELGDHAEEAAATIEKLALVSGGSVPGLSDLSFAMTAAGGSADDLGRVLFMLEQRMENSTSKVSAGLAMIGLSLQDIQNLSADQQLLRIAQAFESADASVNKAAAAMDIFGRSGLTILPQLVGPLTELAAKHQELGSLTAEDAQRAHEFEIATATLGATATDNWNRIGRDVSTATNLIAIGWAGGKAVLSEIPIVLLDVVSGFGYISAAASTFTGVDMPAVASSLKGLADGSGLAAKGLGDYAQSVKDSTAQAPSFTDAMDLQTTAGQYLTDQVNASIKAHDEYEQKVQGVVSSLEGETSKTYETVDAIDQVIASGTDNVDVTQRTVDAITKLQAQGLIPLRSDLVDWADNNRTIKGTVDALHGSLSELTQPIADNSMWAAQLNETFDEARDNVSNLAASGIELNTVETETGAIIGGDVIPAFSKLYDAGGLVDEAKQRMEDLTTSTGAFAQALDTSMNDLPKIIEKSFTGGGGVGGAITAAGADLGKQMAVAIKSGVGDELPGQLDNAIGGAIGSIVGGVGGGLIATGISSLVSWISNIGGPSQTELQGRSTEGQFEQSMGGIAGIGQALTAAGLSADQANAKILALFAAEKSGSVAVQAAINDITTTIQDHTTAVSTGISSIEAAAQVVGTNFPAALRPVVEQLSQLPGLTTSEETALQSLASGGQPSLTELTNTAAKYGLTLDDLGSKTQQLDITTKADQAITDYNELTQSGADTGTVINHMAGSVSGLVDEAIKYGGSLPTALQPIAQALVNAGLLTDSTGQKITDLSNIKFDDTGDPLATGMQSLTDAINNLTKLLGGLPATAANAASGIASALNSVTVQPIQVPIVYDTGGGPSPSLAASGGIVTSRGVEYLSVGGFIPRGTDTVPAMLTPGEEVLSVSSRSSAISGIAALHGTMRDLLDATRTMHQTFKTMLQVQPIMLAHAMRGAR